MPDEPSLGMARAPLPGYGSYLKGGKEGISTIVSLGVHTHVVELSRKKTSRSKYLERSSSICGRQGADAFRNKRPEKTGHLPYIMHPQGPASPAKSGPEAQSQE